MRAWRPGVELGEEIIDRLVEIHALDWREARLEPSAPPAGYLERQVRQWRLRWMHDRTRDVPDIDKLGAWFADHMPSSEATVVHGTYAIDNVIFDEMSARARAVVDWEMATIGDPLADLGFLTATWMEAGEGLESPHYFRSATAASDFLRRRELVERYMRASGRDVQNLRWYQALACWKLAVLIEGFHRRALSEMVAMSLVGQLDDAVAQLAARALRLAKTV